MKLELRPKNGTRRYAVFLSYRHADNKEPGRQWATWLHQILENYEIPSDLVGTTNSNGEPIPASLYPVFRDEEELPADADLTRNIRLALENSTLLVVICSPRAVQSRFVAEEIRYFKELGKADRILALMIDGEPNASEDLAKQTAWLTANMECLPEPLRRGVARNDGSIDWNARTEPIAADARPDGQPVQGWTNGAAYREQLLGERVTEKSKLDSKIQSYEQRLELTKLKVVAGAIGVPLGVLTQRDKAMQLEKARKRARALRRWLGAVALLAVFSIAGGVLALKKQREAEEARIEEAKQRALAQKQSEQRRRLLVEAARSDRLTAEEKLERGESPAAFAYLARSIIYDGTTTFAAEKAVAALNTWSLATLVSFCEDDSWANSVQFSPDGQRIVSALNNNTARVWEAQSGKLLATLKGHEDLVNSAQFSPDGQRIVTASDDMTARVWEAQSGKLLATLKGHEDLVNSAQFSPDGQRIVTASDDMTARVWEAQSGKLLTTLKGHEDQVNSAQFSPDGQRIVTAAKDGTERVWETQSGKLLAILQGQESAQFSPDGRLIVTIYDDKTARVWEAKSGKLLATCEGRVNGAQFNPDCQRIFTASADAAWVWDAQSGKLLATLLKEDQPYVAEFSPDGQRIVIVSEDVTTSAITERVWEAQSNKLLSTLPRYQGDVRVRSAEFSPDYQRIVTISDDKAARVWEARSGKLLATLQGQGGWQFSPNGQCIVTTSGDDAARVWETKSGKLLATLEGHEGGVRSAQFSPDGQRIVTASLDKTARVWEVQSGKLLATLQGHAARVYDAQFSPDGQRIVTAAKDGTARVWEAKSGKLVATIVGHEVDSAQFSPDGQRILTVSNKKGTARVWAAQSGELLATLRGSDNPVESAQFICDGQRIVTTSGNTARVWAAQSGELLATLEGLDNAQFSPDAQLIFASSEDKTAQVWTLLPPRAGAPPPWFPDFLHYMAQRRLNSDGELEPIPPNDWLALRDRLRQVIRETAAQDTPYLRVLRHFVSE